MNYLCHFSKSFLFASIFTLFASASGANSRLDAVHRTFFIGVDGFVIKEVNNLLKGYSRLQEEIGSDALSKLSASASDAEKKMLDALALASQTSDYKTFLVEQQKIMQALAEISDSEAFAQMDAKALKQRFDQFNQQEFCLGANPLLSDTKAPEYEIDETIDTSFIPPPKQYAFRLEVGSEIESADQLEKRMFLPSTTAGCIIGQFFIPLPILGCVIGAAGGAVDSYVRGKIITGAITLIENHKERKAYEEAVESEIFNQKKEIADAKMWADRNPINQELISARSAHFCLAQPVDIQEKFLRESEDWLEAIRNSRTTFAKHTEKIEAARKKLRQFTVDEEARKNINLVSNRMKPGIKTASQAADEAIKALERTLTSCLIGEGGSCEEIASCVGESRAEFETLCAMNENNPNLPALISFSDRLDALEASLADCNIGSER